MLEGLDTELAMLGELMLRVAPRGGADSVTAHLARLVPVPARALELPAPTSPIVEQMLRVWGLVDVERVLLVLALAPELDPHFSSVFTVLGGATDQGYATLGFAQSLVGSVVPLVGRFAHDQPFGRMPIVELKGDGPAPRCALVLADEVLALLLGAPRLDSRWRLEQPVGGVIDDDVTRWARPHPSYLLAIHGAVGSGRHDRACDVATALGRATLTVDAVDLSPTAIPALARDAAWHEATIVIRNVTHDQRAALHALVARTAAPIIVTGLTGLPGWLDVARPTLDIAHAPCTEDERARRWHAELARAGLALDPTHLAQRFALTREPIANAIRLATERAASTATPLTTAQLSSATRAISRSRISELATPLSPEPPEALVLPRAARRELDLAVTWMQNGLATPNPFKLPERHLSCLFHGPPGTGKTLAARVLAARADIDAYRVDLSQVVSKYVGDTEKNLARIFDEAEAAHALLFFDEADALFAKRTEVHTAHDRFANIESGYLLQRLESHRGPVILATNLVRNIEPAMLRRLQIVVEFPLPGVGERLAIWQRCLPTRAADVDLPWLAERFALSGGNIRDAAMTAHVVAAARHDPISMRDLVLAVWRELRRAGRVVEPRELGPWVDTIREYISDVAAVPS